MCLLNVDIFTCEALQGQIIIIEWCKSIGLLVPPYVSGAGAPRVLGQNLYQFWFSNWLWPSH